ncbi:MAG: polysaccharide biosynthesis protein [Clostridia bacterium]|nr:polysaccharide biosynthesis protein [Clostridia bacterium]
MKKKYRTNIVKACLIVADLVMVALSILLSVLLAQGQFVFNADLAFWYLTNAAATVLVSFLFRLYNIVGKSASIVDAIKITVAAMCLFVVNVIFGIIDPFVTFPMALIYSVFMFLGLGLTRFSKRILISLLFFFRGDKSYVRTMIVGAGRAGETLLREIQGSEKIKYLPVCFVDDDDGKQGRRLGGVEIVGKTDKIPEYVAKYNIQEILVAIPSASKRDLKVILESCKETPCKVKVLPGIYQLVNGEASVGALRDVQIADLLGREQVKVDLDEIMGYIEDQVVLVTGGGGSIGSELCRQIATHHPKQLIIFDIYENNAYDIQQELVRKIPDLNLLVLIGSVRDEIKMNHLFSKYRPDIVFNAAAHKHVPLMETSPNEAVKNNVFGTLNVARCADRYAVKTFVQISTDKAVNPTNVMGATKRICEMIIQTIGRHSEHTKFVAVRFGNVLGSNGSVIPLFKKQIAEGGPVTVTHKDIIRYFMTIPEAVSLVLQAGAYAQGGQIFVLDMGEPVRIYDLAYNLIKLSGYEPNVDIEIKCTGLRPGEKLYEERLMSEEGMQKTPNGLINIANPIDLDEAFLWSSLKKLYDAAHMETDNMKQLVADLVPTYKITDN